MALRFFVFLVFLGGHSSLRLERRHRLAQVMVTAGGNQAFAMVALALLDPGDTVLLVRPKWWLLCVKGIHFMPSWPYQKN